MQGSNHAGTNHEHPSESRAAALAQTSIEEVNQARVRMGLARLAADPLLSRVALAHSIDMARRNFYGHLNPDRLGPAERIAAAGYDALSSAENIARGYRDPDLVVNGWMDSPGHRAIILNAEFQVIGAGYFVDPSSPDGHYWTHLFAVPDRAVESTTGNYTEELLALFNLERTGAGYAPLVAPPALQAAIARHTARLAAQGTAGFTHNTDQTVRIIAEDAGYAYRRIMANFVCGRNANTPEAAFDQLNAGGLNRDLLHRDYPHVAIGYHFNRNDTHRHYWFILLTAPQ